MKILITLLILIFSICAHAGTAYNIFIVESPDPENYPHIMARGITDDLKFSASMYNPNDCPEYSDCDGKGLFGKLVWVPVKDRGKFDFMQAYGPNPADIDYTMGFFGMADNGNTTSWYWERYAGLATNPPINADVLLWTHAFNSIGWSSFDAIFENSVIVPVSEGEADWLGATIYDINTSGRTVGSEIGGDAFAFMTSGVGKFEYKFFRNQGNFGDCDIKLYGINDSNIAVGTACKPGELTRRIFYLQVTSVPGTPIWLEDPELALWVNDEATSDSIGINNQNLIILRGNLAGEGDGFIQYNYNTDTKTQLIEFADNPDWALLGTHPVLCDVSNGSIPNLVGYGYNAQGAMVGFVAWPE